MKILKAKDKMTERVVNMAVTQEDQTPITVRLEIKKDPASPDKRVDLHAVIYNRIKTAVGHIKDVEHLGELASLSLMSDLDLKDARERLWQLLGKLDDEADKRGDAAMP